MPAGGIGLLKLIHVTVRRYVELHILLSGSIKSSDPVINAELNEKLNLNSEKISLPENRKQVLLGID